MISINRYHAVADTASGERLGSAGSTLRRSPAPYSLVGSRDAILSRAGGIGAPPHRGREHGVGSSGDGPGALPGATAHRPLARAVCPTQAHVSARDESSGAKPSWQRSHPGWPGRGRARRARPPRSANALGSSRDRPRPRPDGAGRIPQARRDAPLLAEHTGKVGLPAVVVGSPRRTPGRQRCGETRWIPSGATDRCGRRFTDQAQSVGADTTDPPNEASPVQELQVVQVDHR